MLGAAVLRGGVASPALRRRVLHGAALFREDQRRHLLLTGGVVRHPPAEAVLMSALATRAGVPADRITLDTAARNTWQSARNCAALVRERGWRSVLLVTDAFHMRRSLLAFAAFGVDARPSPAPADGGSLARDEYREWAALAWYGLRAALAAPGRTRR